MKPKMMKKCKAGVTPAKKKRQGGKPVKPVAKGVIYGR